MDYIKLYNVPFNSSYDDVIDFSTEAERSAFFENCYLADFTENDISVVRELQNVRIYANYNSVYTANYAIFANTIDGVSRTWYAFIDRVRWEGIGVVGLDLTIDIFQSYLFKFTFMPSFVDRGHTKRFFIDGSVDFRYLRTPETVSPGDELNIGAPQNVQVPNEQQGLYKAPLLVCWQFGGLTDTEPVEDAYPTINRIALKFAQRLTFVRTDRANQNMKVVINGQTQTVMTINTMLNVNLKSSNSVHFLLTYNTPFQFTWVNENTISIVGNSFKWRSNALIPNSTEETSLLYQLGVVNHSFDMTEPKLSCYPYDYYFLARSHGEKFMINPQSFTVTDAQGKIAAKVIYEQSCTLDASERFGLSQDDYDGGGPYTMVTDSNIGELPAASNPYDAFMQQKRGSFWTGLATGAVGSVVGGATKGTAGVIAGSANALLGMADKFAQLGDLARQPNELKNGGNNVFSCIFDKTAGVCSYHCTIPESAKDRVRHYFQYFGYTVGERIDNPWSFAHSRQYYNYIKTTQAEIVGAIQSDHIKQLRQIFNHGVRIWHYQANAPYGGMYNYDVNNIEVTQA